MTIVKYIFLFILLILMQCKQMESKEFKVFGKEELLKNSKITIIEISDSEPDKVQTLLNLGNVTKLKTENKVSLIYEIYISYKDSLVNVLKYENIMVNANDHINHIYINEEDSMIKVTYFGRESDLKSQEGFSKILLPKKEFFRINNIEKKEDIIKYEKFFFNKL